mgnify:CR=1 FL=1
MHELQATNFDLTVTKINFVLHKETHPSWQLATRGNNCFMLVVFLTVVQKIKALKALKNKAFLIQKVSNF